MKSAQERQLKTSRKVATELFNKIVAAREFEHVKAAVVEFVEGMDQEAHILGDEDLAQLYVGASERRGKNRMLQHLILDIAIRGVNVVDATMQEGAVQ